MQGFKHWRWKVWAVRQPHSVDCRFVEQRLHDIVDGNSWTFCQLRETLQCTLWNSWTLHTWILQHQLNLTLIRVNITLLSNPNIIRISYSSSSSHTSSTSSSMPPRMDKLKKWFMFLNAFSLLNFNSSINRCGTRVALNDQWVNMFGGRNVSDWKWSGLGTSGCRLVGYVGLISWPRIGLSLLDLCAADPMVCFPVLVLAVRATVASSAATTARLVCLPTAVPTVLTRKQPGVN